MAAAARGATGSSKRSPSPERPSRGADRDRAVGRSRSLPRRDSRADEELAPAAASSGAAQDVGAGADGASASARPDDAAATSSEALAAENTAAAASGSSD